MGGTDHVQPATLLLLLVLTHTGQCEGAQQPDRCPTVCMCHVTQAYCDNQGLDFVPKFQRKVTVIYLRNNVIKKLRMTWFDQLPWLQHLLLKNNRITRIERGTFLNLTSLISLSLTQNNLRRVATETFYGLRRLRVISLRDNKLTRIDDIFIDLTNVQLINIANNRIRHIGRHTFVTNKRLSVLDLRNNSITIIHRRTFRYLPLLKFLVLRDNPIKTITFDFRPNSHLELIDFTNCSLKRMARGLPYSIKDLRMSENNIARIDRRDFRKTRQIQVLDLNHNRISWIHRKSFLGLRVLNNLYIGKNLINQMPRNLPTTLQGLYANFNNIGHVPPRLFPRGNQLEHLYLNNNKIEIVHQHAFDKLYHLRSLDLNTNSITLLKQYTFCNLSNLDLLDLSNNPIMMIEDDTFVGLDKLRIFQLSSISQNVHFARLSLFKGMRNLRFLDMHNTPMLTSHMEQDAFYEDYLDSVQNLNLMNNKLRGLPSDFPEHFPSLQAIKLSGNPWHCDRSIYWLVKWVRNNTVSFFAPDYMLCETPPELKGRPLIYLHESELKGTMKKHGHRSQGQTNQPRRSIADNYGPVRVPNTYEEKYTFTITKQTVIKHKTAAAPIHLTNASSNQPNLARSQIGSHARSSDRNKSNAPNAVVNVGKTAVTNELARKPDRVGLSADDSDRQLGNRTMQQLGRTQATGHLNLADNSEVRHNSREKQTHRLPPREQSQHTTTNPPEKPSLRHTTQHDDKHPRYLSSVPIPNKTKSWNVTKIIMYAEKRKDITKLEKDRARSDDKNKFDNDID